MSIILRREHILTGHRESMKHVKIPYWLVIKYYWKRLIVVSAIWFIYDVSCHCTCKEFLLIRPVLDLFIWYFLLDHSCQHL